ncbi:MAG: hypothetical protein U0X73_09750 [Thermoanaerobaculia bacterium]
MPVYDRRYRGYEGERRPARRAIRSLVARGLAEVFASRLTILLLVVAALPTLGFGGVLYVANNLAAFAAVGVDPGRGFIAIDANFFFTFLVVQSSFAFLVAAFVGPTLVAPDLAHNGLVLYLSRPLSRTGYVIGKAAILVILLSVLTWVPGELLLLLQSTLASGWAAANAGLFGALFGASALWIAVLTLFALAISAWVRWRPFATAMLFLVFVVGKGLGHAVMAILATRWGQLLIVDDLIRNLWRWLFTREAGEGNLSVSASAVALVAFGLLAIWMLSKKIRPVEVSR